MAVSPSSLGQEVSQPSVDESQPPLSESAPALSTLHSLIESMRLVKEKQTKIEKDLKQLQADKAAASQIAELEQALAVNATRYAALKSNFEEVATRIGPETFNPKAPEAFELDREMESLFEPLVRGMKDATAQARELERLQAEVVHYERRAALVRKGLENIARLLPLTTDSTVKRDLTELNQGWIDQETKLKGELDAAKFKLEEHLREQTPMVGIFTEMLKDFFANRGKNLILSVLGGLGVFLVLRWIHAGLRRTVLSRSNGKSTRIRLVDLSFHGFTIIMSVFGVITVLFVRSEWLLLGLALALLTGLIWAATKALPHLYSQAQLMLNLGSVRENERVLYQGIPWQVRSIDFHTNLYNPALSGGNIRLPLSELPALQSRPFNEEESWFPCRPGEWVALSDDTFGEVLSQSPEMVRLRTLTNSSKSYRTVDFLGLAPENVSESLGVRVRFGIDYRHQKIATTEVPKKLQEKLIDELDKLVEPDDITQLRVEFCEAGTSSLDYVVLALFSGRLAARRPFLERAIQRICVEACNENGWGIPFPQLTLHQAEGHRE